MTRPYGKELILDLHNCRNSFSRKSIRKFLYELCTVIGMKGEKLVWWDDYKVSPEEQQTDPNLKGTTAILFMLPSNITIHTLELLGAVYINLFSCKDFDADVVADFAESWFEGENIASQVIDRQ